MHEIIRGRLAMVLVVICLAVGLAGGCGNTTGKGETARPQGGVREQGRGYRFDCNGWTYLHLEGEPYERGYQHGFLMAEELAEIRDMLVFTTYFNTGKEWSYFVAAAEQVFMPRAEAEFVEEIKGIADGAAAAGTVMTWQEILAWNGYEELTGYWWPGEQAGKYPQIQQPDNEHCSAFIATGSWTEDGGVVMAHNSWTWFDQGQYYNVVADVVPSQGHRILMQCVPGFIDSATDYFTTDAGLMGTETTIGGYSDYNPDEEAEFFRVRKAMQYADDLDGFVELMQKDNNGGYANSWLLADSNTNEIMRFEQGLKYQNIERTTDGYYAGFNTALDPRIRNLECDGAYSDIRTAMGARQVRLVELMDMYKGKLNVQAGEAILADHYDVYLQRTGNPGSRTVDGHYYLDDMAYWPARRPYQPSGAVDGKVMDSRMARSLSFYGRFGNSCGMAFDASSFFSEHPQWNYLEGIIKDRPSQPWTLFEPAMR
jgi:hypothetical protein